MEAWCKAGLKLPLLAPIKDGESGFLEIFYEKGERLFFELSGKYLFVLRCIPRPREFGLGLGFNGANEPSGRIRDIWRFSATNAIVYFAASSVGALLCDPLTEIFVGRRGAIFVAAITTFAASIGEAFCHRWETLFACRL